jgi:hypothetical protein
MPTVFKLEVSKNFNFESFLQGIEEKWQGVILELADKVAKGN